MLGAADDEASATFDAPGGDWVDIGAVDAAVGEEGAVTLGVTCGFWGRAAGEKGCADDGTVALTVPCGLRGCSLNRPGVTGGVEDDRISDTELGRAAD